jgi:nicotinamide riboside kinase
VDIRSGIDVYEGGGGAGCEVRISRDDFQGAWRIGCAPFFIASIQRVSQALAADCTIERSARFAANRHVHKLENMKRVVIIGRGASGKSTLARRLGQITGLPVTEVDKIFWQPGLVAMPREQWVAMQEKLVARDRWIIEGDLGGYDAVEVRLRCADTIIFLDFSLVRCAWRAIRRSRERADFWRWLVAYRYQSRPILRAAIAKHAPHAVLHVFRSPKALGRFVADVAAVTPVA